MPIDLRFVRRRGGGLTFPVPTPGDPPAEADPITVSFAWVGAVDATSAVVKARCADGTAVSMLVSTSPSLTSPGTVVGTEGNDEMWTFSATGLTADTAYYYGFPGSDLEGAFQTFVTAGTAASFLIAAGSCAGHTNQAQYVTGASRTSDSPAFERIEDRAPALFIHLGDLHYRDINTNSLASFRTAYQDVLANARQASLYRNIATSYVWDDHDYGANDATGSSASKPAAQTTYRDYYPHYTLPSASAIYQQFVYGRVRFIRLDTRSERSSNSAADNASKTMLGATQKQWLKDQLLAATEPVIVLVVQDPWLGTLSDNWGSFSTERQELAEYFEDNALTSRLYLLHGDMHRVAADDGTNSQYDPDAVTDGPPVVCFAPLDGGPTTLTGTYSEGNYTVRRQQYGTLEFTDTGSQITVTARGYAVNETVETLLFTMTHVFTG